MADVFTPDYMAAVPPARLSAIARDLQREHGAILAAQGLRRTAPHMARFRLVFERGQATGTIRLDPAQGFRIQFFTITDVMAAGDSIPRLQQDFAALPGKAGFAVVPLNGPSRTPLATYRANERFAIGSTFKLWVLDALASDVAAGKRQWDDVATLGPPSLPSGILQDWPRTSHLTLESLATLMISISDNTATDALIGTLGRDAIETHILAHHPEDPGGLVPLMTTAELFAIKSRGAGMATAWGGADAAGRRRILASLAPPGDPQQFDMSVLDSGRPAFIDQVEWFASPGAVAHLLDRLRQHPDPAVAAILAVSPHLPAGLQDRLAYAGYKGGSENGVIAMNWLVRTHAGQWFAIAASWNDPRSPVDDARFERLAHRLIALTLTAP